jgi:hypothetical protein
VVLDIAEVGDHFARGTQCLAVAGKTPDDVGFVVEELPDLEDLPARCVDLLQRKSDVIWSGDGDTVFHRLHAGFYPVDEWSETVDDVVAAFVSKDY